MREGVVLEQKKRHIVIHFLGLLVGLPIAFGWLMGCMLCISEADPVSGVYLFLIAVLPVALFIPAIFINFYRSIFNRTVVQTSRGGVYFSTLLGMAFVPWGKVSSITNNDESRFLSIKMLKIYVTHKREVQFRTKWQKAIYYILSTNYGAMFMVEESCLLGDTNELIDYYEGIKAASIGPQMEQATA